MVKKRYICFTLLVMIDSILINQVSGDKNALKIRERTYFRINVMDQGVSKFELTKGDWIEIYAADQKEEFVMSYSMNGTSLREIAHLRLSSCHVEYGPEGKKNIVNHIYDDKPTEMHYFIVADAVGKTTVDTTVLREEGWKETRRFWISVTENGE